MLLASPVAERLVFLDRHGDRQVVVGLDRECCFEVADCAGMVATRDEEARVVILCVEQPWIEGNRAFEGVRCRLLPAVVRELLDGDGCRGDRVARFLAGLQPDRIERPSGADRQIKGDILYFRFAWRDYE